MRNSITTTAAVKAKPRPVRSLPAWQITERLRKRGIRQWDIAKAVGCSQAYVSDVINRRRRRGAAVELTWRAVEEALA
jgi:predicted transcriptional regulator